MTADQILAEIREANLSYLMLAQSLIRVDREQALFRLGVSEDTAKLIGALTPAQMMKIAATNTLLCRFRMDDDLVWGLITSHGKAAANDSRTIRSASSQSQAGIPFDLSIFIRSWNSVCVKPGQSACTATPVPTSSIASACT